MITLIINDQPFTCAADCTVAGALAQAGFSHTRTSVTGQPRAPLCGMGICAECRVTIDDVPYQLACQTLVAPGMRITVPAQESPCNT
jgi:hypothetical protein